MRITITGRNIELTEGLKAAVEERLTKLEKYFTADTDVFVTLSVEKERQKIEVTIPIKGHVIRSEQVSNDMYVSIDLVEEVIERQLKKYRTKLASKKMNVAESFNADLIEVESFVELESKVTTFYAMNVLEGQGCLKVDNKEYNIVKGDSFLIPAALGKFTFEGNLKIITSYM